MNFNLNDIKNASREPVQNIDSVVMKLNVLAAQNTNPNVHIHWEIGKDSFGPCLKALLNFTHPKACLNFCQAVHNLQEACDHHANLTMHNFKTISLMLSTHQPTPAITMVDVMFGTQIAYIVSEKNMNKFD